jgi:hypothetical protein
VEVGLNKAHQLLVCSDDVSSFSGNINTMKGNTCALLDATEKDGLEVTASRIFRNQITRESHNESQEMLPNVKELK